MNEQGGHGIHEEDDLSIKQLQMETISGLRSTTNDQAASKQVPLAASPQGIIPFANPSAAPSGRGGRAPARER